MRALKFTLSGKMACFRKPEINSSVYLTYSNIPKVPLLGILGSVIGLSGYTQAAKGELPEFYNKLCDFKIGIVPPKKNTVQKTNIFNNATGSASHEDGGNLIVKENILINPTWDIYILSNDTEEYKKLEEYILNQKTEFIPYLGRNDYPATISNAANVELEDITSDILTYDSLVPGTVTDCIPSESVRGKKFFFVESLPIALHPITKQYIYQSFLLTTECFKKQENSYSYNDINIKFI